MGSAAGHSIITMFTIRNTVTKIQTGIGRGPGLYTLLERGRLGDCNCVSLHGARRRGAQSQVLLSWNRCLKDLRELFFLRKRKRTSKIGTNLFGSGTREEGGCGFRFWESQCR